MQCCIIIFASLALLIVIAVALATAKACAALGKGSSATVCTADTGELDNSKIYSTRNKSRVFASHGIALRLNQYPTTASRNPVAPFNGPAVSGLRIAL
jgi:hypothetical protein